MEIVKKMVKEENLCLNCLGRSFAGLLSGLTNEERGRSLIITLSMSILAEQLRRESPQREELLREIAKKYEFRPLMNFLRDRGKTLGKVRSIKTCQICRGVFSRLNEISEKIVENLMDYDYETFMVGVSVPVEVEERDDEIKSKYGLSFSESIRNEISREIGKKIRELTGKAFSPTPELIIRVNPYTEKIQISSKPVAYKGLVELKRKVKIFSSICLNCRGKGCKKCKYTGKKPGSDVEYVLGSLLLKKTGGKKWHFSIRKLSEEAFEFKISIKQPKIRRINFEEIKLNEYYSFRVKEIFIA